MGAWLGALGGLGMIAMIVALLMVFLRQMGVRVPAEMPRTMAVAVAVALAEMMVAGIVHHMHVAPASILDIPAVWTRLPLWLAKFWPFNGYVALLVGAWSAWTVRERLGAQWMYLLLACPGAVMMFLPAWPMAVAFMAALALRNSPMKPTRIPYPLYLALLCALALANGWFLITFVGSGVA